MKILPEIGPLEKAVARSTEIVNSVKAQIPKFHPKSQRCEFAKCFLAKYEEFKLQIEKEYIKLVDKESPPLPSK